MEEALDKENNQPNILFLKDEDEDDPHHQLFIAVERAVMLESNNIVTAVFLALAAHCVQSAVSCENWRLLALFSGKGS